ncbi:transposase family protein [Nocardiopsis sp. NPDC055551]
MSTPRDHEGLPCLHSYPPDPGRAHQTRTPGPPIHYGPAPLPGHRSPRGRWYSLTCILLLCACATISGARSIDELAEWGRRTHPSVLASLGVRTHPWSGGIPRWRRTSVHLLRRGWEHSPRSEVD